MAKITGRSQHSQRLGRIPPETRRRLGAALYAAGQIIEIEAERSITEGSVSGAGHVPSLPGEPPNADTRQLDTSIATVRVSDVRVEVEATAPHSVPLEFGTSRMIERPYLRPATRKKRAEAIDLVRRAVAASTR